MNDIADINKFFDNLEWIASLLECMVGNGEPLPIDAEKKVINFSQIIQQLEVKSKEMRFAKI